MHRVAYEAQSFISSVKEPGHASIRRHISRYDTSVDVRSTRELNRGAISTDVLQSEPHALTGCKVDLGHSLFRQAHQLRSEPTWPYVSISANIFHTYQGYLPISFSAMGLILLISLAYVPTYTYNDSERLLASKRQ
jgi:hypothetical protein